MPSGDRAPAERFGFEGVVGERFDDFGVVAVVRSLSPLGPRGESNCAVLACYVAWGANLKGRLFRLCSDVVESDETNNTDSATTAG